MNAAAPLPTVTVEEAKARLGEVLNDALARPVGISDGGGLLAYIVSKGDFDYLLNKLEELDDQLWLARAESAPKDEFISEEVLEAWKNDVRNSTHAEAPDTE